MQGVKVQASGFSTRIPARGDAGSMFNGAASFHPAGGQAYLPRVGSRPVLGQETPVMGQETPTGPAPTAAPVTQTVPTLPTRGQGGKTQITREEAAQLLELLDVVLAPIEGPEAEREDLECLRELSSGPFPIVVRLRDRMREFVATAQPGEMFEVSQGEITVAEKSVQCAESLGRLERFRTAVTVGGVGAGALLLLLLL